MAIKLEQIDEEGLTEEQRETINELSTYLAQDEGRMYRALARLIMIECPHCDNYGTSDYEQIDEHEWQPIQCEACGPIYGAIKARLERNENEQ